MEGLQLKMPCTKMPDEAQRENVMLIVKKAPHFSELLSSIMCVFGGTTVVYKNVKVSD